MENYGNESYWIQRYEECKDFFDWYQRWIKLQPLLEKYIKEEDSILNLGCGNSRLSEEMAQDGYNNIINVDNSESVIDFMNSKTKFNSETFRYELGDVKNLTSEDHTFDVVLDKATLDCFFCGENSFEEVHKVLKEVYRVLKPKGKFVFISFSSIERRMKPLENESFDWDITTEKIVKMRQNPGDGDTVTEEMAEPEYQTIFICSKKGTDAPEETEEDLDI